MFTLCTDSPAVKSPAVPGDLAKRALQAGLLGNNPSSPRKVAAQCEYSFLSDLPRV